VRSMPDLAAIHQQLKANKHVTLQLLWEEYREDHPGGYSYSRFCELYETWRHQQNVTLRQEHRAGELTGQQLEARFTATTVEIFHREVRVASHLRSYVPYRASTVHEHRPKAHLEWTPSRLIHRPKLWVQRQPRW
jgi:transposase